MREIAKETKRIMREAGRAYIAQRAHMAAKRERAESDAEIRAALRGAGIELGELGEFENGAEVEHVN